MSGYRITNVCRMNIHASILCQLNFCVAAVARQRKIHALVSVATRILGRDEASTRVTPETGEANNGRHRERYCGWVPKFARFSDATKRLILGKI